MKAHRHAFTPVEPPAVGKRKAVGFTLVELLVVVAIIAVLAALLMPSLKQAVIRARIVACGSNLNQYGAGIYSYSCANNGAVMRMVHQWGNQPYPDYIRFDSRNNPAWAGEWGIEQIKPYIDAHRLMSSGGSDPYAANLSDNKNPIGGIAICPSVDVELMNKFIRLRNFSPGLRPHQFIEFPYFYWGRADIATAAYLRNGAEKELVGRYLQGGKILMTDSLYFDASDWNRADLGAWRYNHGRRGWAFNEEHYLPQDFGVVPNITGINRLFGDGSVSWKTRDQFEYLDRMFDPGNYPIGYIGLNGRDSFYY